MHIITAVKSNKQIKYNCYATGLAQLVEQAHIYRSLLLNAAAVGSTPTCGPLLHVSPLSCLHLSCGHKGLQMPQKIISKKKIFITATGRLNPSDSVHVRVFYKWEN